jgi:hypothetical protein
MIGDHERLEEATEPVSGPSPDTVVTRESARMPRPGFLSELRSAPSRLSRRQRAIFWSVAAVVALSRLLALSATLWDWDEALFTTAMRDYDVAVHHPHPPGFPLYIVAARIVRLLTTSDFRALQLITVIGAMALFPLVAGFLRELRFSFSTAILSALLFSFFPNVWFYGGTAFSDISATAVATAACLLLLRGSRSRRDYLLGALMLGVATGFRTQSLVIGCAPALTATLARLTDREGRTTRDALRDLGLACLIGGSVIVITYAGAAWASSDPPTGFLQACRGVREWVRTVDSYLSPRRPPLRALWSEFFLRPMRAGRIDIAVFILALTGVVQSVRLRRAGAAVALLTFVPFMLLAWLMLDYHSIARYSVAYVALYALFAVEGAVAVARPLGRRHRDLSIMLPGVLVIALACDFAIWTLPALREARQVAPTEAAMRWIASHTRPGSRVLVADNVAPFAVCDLMSRQLAIIDPQHPPVLPDAASLWYVTEGRAFSSRALMFARPRGRIWELARQFYFEVSVEPASDLAVYASGWYGLESDEARAWRWMGRRGVVLLEPIGGPARLTVVVSVPSQFIGSSTMTIRFNGAVVDRVLASRETTERVLDLTSKKNAFNEVEISTDHIINPQRENISGDPRDLGLRLESMTWSSLSTAGAR